MTPSMPRVESGSIDLGGPPADGVVWVNLRAGGFGGILIFQTPSEVVKNPTRRGFADHDALVLKGNESHARFRLAGFIAGSSIE